MESVNEESIDTKKTFTIKNDFEIKQNDNLFNNYTISQFSKIDSTNVSLLHDPYGLNHIHGLRNRLFKTFNAFANILENALSPPVLKITKKLQIKIKEYNQLANKNYISDLNALLSEIKKESKNENLQNKKNKTSIVIRRIFQMKLIQCYKLAITTIEVCSKTLEAGIYNPVQSKMKKLIQIISTLSLTTGKYMYGELFKKKKKDSFDLVEQCKILENMLEECGYKDTEHENIHSNTLNELAKKALIKNKTKLFSVDPNWLSMYNQVKPKLGTSYAQRWSKNKDVIDKHFCNGKMINEKPVLLEKDNMVHSNNTFRNNLPMEEINIEDTNKLYFKGIENKKPVDDDLTNLTTYNNVRLYIVKENTWRKFPIKNISQNGCLVLNISPENVENICSYKRQFKQHHSSTIPECEVNTISNITESVMDDLISEIIRKIEDTVITTIKELIKYELFE